MPPSLANICAPDSVLHKLDEPEASKAVPAFSNLVSSGEGKCGGQSVSAKTEVLLFLCVRRCRCKVKGLSAASICLQYCGLDGSEVLGSGLAWGMKRTSQKG